MYHTQVEHVNHYNTRVVFYIVNIATLGKFLCFNLLYISNWKIVLQQYIYSLPRNLKCENLTNEISENCFYNEPLNIFASDPLGALSPNVPPCRGFHNEITTPMI